METFTLFIIMRRIFTTLLLRLHDLFLIVHDTHEGLKSKNNHQLHIK